MSPVPPPGATAADSPRLLRNSMFLIGIELATKILGLIFFVLLARFLGATDLGLYAYALTLANFFVLLPKFGFESLVQREVGRDQAVSRQYFRDLSLLRGGLALAALVALIALALLVLQPAQGRVVGLVGAFVFAYSYLEFADTFFRALGRSEYEVLVRLWFSLANLGLGYYLLATGHSLAAVVAGQLLCVLTAISLALIILVRLTPPAPEPLVLKKLWAYVGRAAPFAGIVIALFFSNQTGILILSYFTDKTEVGYLAAGLRLFDNLTLIPAALMGAFLPVVSRYYRTSVRAFTTTLRLTLKFLFIFAAPLAVGMYCLASQLTLFLFKEAFAPTAGALQILSLALIFSFWNYLGDNVLIARNQERKLLGLAWFGAAVHVAANLALIPYLSYLGSCWATLTTQAFYSVVLFSYTRRYVHLSGIIRLVWRPALAALVMGLGVWWLRDFTLILVIPAGMALYALMLWATRTLSSEEIENIKSAWKIRWWKTRPAAATR